MVAEYLIEKAFDKAYELIKLGFRKLDTNQSFILAYENALVSYKSEFGEDLLYREFFIENYMYYYKKMKKIIDEFPSARELEKGLVTWIIEELPNCSLENIKIFVVKLFTELFFTNEYKSKILEYRQDNEIGKIYTAIQELKEIISGLQPIKVKFSNNMFQYYLNKWNNELFLHKNAINKVRLKDIYILPFYKERNSSNSEGIRRDLEDKIDLFLGDSVNGNRRRPMIILADAGMGKSSLVSYICSKCPQKNNLIVLKFSDLHKDHLNTKILSSVLHELNCEIQDLRNKRLIIDGFDESEFTSNKNRLLSDFFHDCQNIQGLKVLVTSRVNYIDYNKFMTYKLYYLQFMNEDQINKMCENYFSLSKDPPFRVNNISNNEVIGVPLILYMILSLKIHVEDGTGICELYEKIFAFDGGIYDRMNFGDYDGYTEEVHPIAYDEVKQEVHLISQLIAFSMFEASSLLLTSDEYLKIVKGVSEDRVEDFAISNYFYIESSTYSLSFCHKSIYEYYVAEFIYNKILPCTSKETLAYELAYLFKESFLTKEITNFLIYKIEKKYKDDIKEYLLIESTVNHMVETGMTYFLPAKIEDVLKIECNIFINILLILEAYKAGTNYNDYKNINISIQFLRQLNNRFDSMVNLKEIFLSDLELSKKNFFNNVNLSVSTIKDVIFKNSDLSSSIINYADIQRTSFEKAFLRNTQFYETVFSNINMSYADFSNCIIKECIMNDIQAHESNFESCSFENTRLTDVTFVDANLSNANFREAVLSNVYLKGAILNNVDFRGADLTGVNLHLAQQVNSIKIDKQSIFCNAIVDSTFVPKLLKCNSKNLVGLKIYDIQKNKELSLEEYKKIFPDD